LLTRTAALLAFACLGPWAQDRASAQPGGMEFFEAAGRQISDVVIFDPPRFALAVSA
jgi:predicted methyltransferase